MSRNSAAAPRASAAQRPEPEIIADVGDGIDGADDGQERNEMGLTAEEQAEFDNMRTGGDAPAAGDEPSEPEGDADGDDGDDDSDPEPVVEQPQQRQPGEKEPAQQQQKPPKTINYNKHQKTLAKERAEREALQQQLAREREDRIKLNTRLEMINEALQQQAAPAAQQQDAPEAPQNPFEEPDVDPNENFAEAIAQLNRRQRYQLENQQQVETRVAETQEDTQIKETFTRDFAAYAAKDPSLPAAYQHLKDARLTQICLGEFGKDPNNPEEVFTPQEVQRMVQMFNAEEKWLVGKAIKERRSPAAAIMAMAKTFGFKPEAPQQQQQAPPAARPAPRAQVPAKQPVQRQAAEPTAADMLEELRQNQENGRSLSDGGGAPPPTGLTAEMVLRMGDDEFAEMIDTMPAWQLNQLMGRVPT